MAGRPKIYDENIALEKATAVFWEKGYEAASLEELLDAMGIGKGSFYLAYKNGKQELFEKSINRFYSNNLKELLERIQYLDNPVNAIKDFYVSMVKNTNLLNKNGCFYFNTIAQTQSLEMKEIAGIKMKEMTDYFAKVLVTANENDVIKIHFPEKLLGPFLLNLWAGLNVMRHIEKDETLLINMIDEHFKIIF